MLKVIKEVSSKGACASCSSRTECEELRNQLSPRLDSRGEVPNPWVPRCKGLASFQIAAAAYEPTRVFGNITATGVIGEEGSYSLSS